MQNTERTLPENDVQSALQAAEAALDTNRRARVIVDLYEEPNEPNEIPVVIMVPKGVPYSALHD